jgi:hypothetical protein
VNEAGNVYCVNCGATVSPADNVSNSLPPTQAFQNSPAQQSYNPAHSIETAVLPVSQYNQSMPNFAPAPPYTGEQQTAGKKKLAILAGSILGVILLLGLGGLYFLTKNSASAETLPDHLGMFLQNPEKNKITEIKKQDFTNALEGTDKLLKGDNLAVTEENPNLILYSDGKDVPLSDLRLIQLDTVKADGNLKQLDFQAAPIENKPEMKRIRIPDGLAKGKYAFAVLDGYLDDGKHKFWAFEVISSGKSNNDSDLKAATVSVKSKENKTDSTNTVKNVPTQPVAPVAPPPGATIRYVSTTDVILRSGSSQSSAARGKLGNGAKVYVIGYSSNYEYFYSKKTGQGFNSNYAEVQTENGRRGWVYAAFLR